MKNDLLLVGSVPLDTAEDVMKQFGEPLSSHLAALPDGEVGPRQHWVSRVHYQVLAGHPQLEVLRHPKPDNGIERQNPRDPSDSWQFKVRDGVDQVTFGDPGWRLGIARDAINSYFIFKTMKERGELPSHLRFQVSIPMVNSVLPPRIFPQLSDADKIKPGFEAALAAEVQNIVERIPNSELAIQWDMASEVHDAYGATPGLPAEGRIERNVAQVRRLSSHIPEPVALGFHFCFGTLGGWPRFQPKDLGAAVELGNATIAAAGRRVNWIHFPVLPDSGDMYLAPLQHLRPQGARVYLGVIHNMEGFAQRVMTARKYLPDFGIAAYCGLGRVPRSELPAVLQEHLDALGQQ